MKTLLRYFVRGILVLAPLGLTLYIAYWTVRFVDGWVPTEIPGLGLLLTITTITLVGFFTSSVIGRAVVDRLEGWLGRLPLVKLLYGSFRDLIGAFVGKNKKFDKPVAVAVSPGSSIRLLGFLTREDLAFEGFEGHVAVYFPQSYNFAGNVVICPRDQVEPLDVASGDLMTFVVSGGVSGHTARRTDEEFETEHGIESTATP